MAEEKEKIQIGGARAGAGRKPKDGVGTHMITLKLNRKHYNLIKALVENEEVASVSEFIGRAVREKLMREGLV